MHHLVKIVHYFDKIKLVLIPTDKKLVIKFKCINVLNIFDNFKCFYQSFLKYLRY